MANAIAQAVQREITAQMRLIREMVVEVELLHNEALLKGDQDILETTEALAMKLDALSKSAYEVGETVLVRAA